MSDPDAHRLKDELYELIRRDERIFEFLQAGSLDGIWYWDIEKPDEEWLSPRFKEVFGYAVDEMAHTPDWWQANIHPDDLEVALANFNAHVADPSYPYDQIVRYRHKNGSTVWVRCRGIAVRDEEGRAVRMLGAHTDVTELEEAKARLEVANAELRSFASVVAHDLKSPLATIAGFAHVLASRLGDHEDEMVRESVARIARSVGRVSVLVEDLLGYSMLLQDLPVEDVAMDEVAAWVVDLVEDGAKERGVTLTLQSDLPVVEMPLAAARRVVHNLVDNAIKYAGEGATVRIVTAPAGVGQVAVAVEDDGPGIPEEDRLRVFAPGVRLGPREANPGLGLGLSGAREVAERHGGTLRIEERPGGGARFVLTGRSPDPDRASAPGRASADA